MGIKIALAGNPNCGKTTMFNELTGSAQYVGNWPGVTVEKKVGKLKGHKDVEIVDLPGIYSLSPYTLEEVVARDFLLQDKPEAIINIVDGTNLERNLYLTTQLLEIGVPVVIALNMADVLHKQGDIVNVKMLSEKLGCEIIETAALKGDGCLEVAEKAIKIAEEKRNVKAKHYFSKSVELALTKIQDILATEGIQGNKRWLAIKIFERDAKVLQQINFSERLGEELEEVICALENEMDDDSESIMTNERYQYISQVLTVFIKKANTTKITVSDKIDQIVTNRVLALPIFAAIMFLVYYLSVSTVGTMMTDWTNDVLFGEIIPPAVEEFLVGAGTAEWLNSLILDGIIGGVGAVLGFLPQMMVLFLLLGILEDCGYMARIAFIMDRVFRRFGLSGKSFIPMLIGTGCSVPGIMASRTIENERDRKMTIITTSFIPCGAKLPIIALIAGALFEESPWVAPSAYFIGILAVIISGIILKKTDSFAGEPAPFVMELPPYHLPSAKSVLLHMWSRARSFIVKAGTIIFLSSGVIWFLSSFNGAFEMVEIGESILATLGQAVAPIFAPLGFGTWEATVATVTGLIAKENVVATFGILFGFAEVAEDGTEIWPLLQQSFTVISAYSFLIFNLLCAPCFAAIGTIRREMGNMKWTMFAISYQTLFAYVMAFIVYQIGTYFTDGQFSILTAVAIAFVAGILYLLFKPYRQSEKNLKLAKRAVNA